MHIENLIRMANQIGAFFEAMPDRVEAMEGIAQHIKRNWESRMRRELMAHVEEHQGEGLSAIVIEAIEGHRAMLSPPEKV